MSLKEQLKKDLKQALRQKDKRRKGTIRLALTAITNAEIAQKKELDDPGVLAVLSRETKKCQESIEEYGRGNRDDLVAEAEAELAILKAYLPQQLSPEEIEQLARATIEKLGVTGMADMGQVMRELMQELRGQADGKLVNQIVRGLLSGQG